MKEKVVTKVLKNGCKNIISLIEIVLEFDIAQVFGLSDV